ncbi:MAG: hypothetical protein WKF88_09160 [Ferruginibacter sp.]
MKMLSLCILFFSSAFAFSQKIALLDKELKKPILYTDSLTLEQVTSNLVAIPVDALDTLMSNLKAIKSLLSNNLQRAKMKSFMMRSGASELKVTTVAHAYGDSYEINLVTNLNEINSTYQFASHTNLNKGNIKRIDKFMAYLQNASALFNKKYVEMTPRYLQVEVYQ